MTEPTPTEGVRRRPPPKHPRLWRAYANGATLANGLCGVGAIAYVILGNKLFALALIFIGIGWDGLDGYFSRRSGLPSSLFGRVADSIADSVTFALAPAAVVLFDNYPTASWDPYRTAILLVAVWVAALALGRLLYFTWKAHALPYFLGASTPQNAIGLIFLVLLLQNPAYVALSPVAFLVATALLAILMVLPIPYPKVRTHQPLRWMVVAMTVTGVFAVALPNLFRPASGTAIYEAGYAMAAVGVALLVFFYLVGPFLVDRNGTSSHLPTGQEPTIPPP